MASLLSPGVQVSEIDLTTIVPASATTEGASVGQFPWGPLEDIQLLSSEDELAATFGKPDSSSAISFFTAANFLAYGNNLHVVRIADNTSAQNASSLGTPTLLIKNKEDYDSNDAGGAGPLVGPWAARYAGALGNSLRVSLCPSAAAYSKTFTAVSSTGTALNRVLGGFVAGLEVGTLIIDAAGNIRSIASITTDQDAVLNAAFPVDLASATVTAKWQYADVFGIAPGTSAYVADRGGSGDELHVVVIDEDGHFTGIPGQVLEKYAFLSKASDAKAEDGSSAYYAAAISAKSAFIYWMHHLSIGTNWGSVATGTTFTAVTRSDSASLSGGADGTAPTDADKIRGWGLFVNKEQTNVSLLIGGDADSTVAIYLINDICEVRKDCIALLSPPMDAVVDNKGNEVADTITYRNLLPSSSYGVLDGNWKSQYDKYNDAYRWLPCSGDTAGLCVRTDQERDSWWSPAGFNRGGLKNVTKLAYNPNQAERDELYINSIDPIVQFPGQGAVLFGDKTLLSKPSAFDRINVRRLFIVLEKSISTAAKFSLFEFNDEATRQAFRALVEPFLRDVQGRRGLTEFRVVCDSTNNTAEVINRNEFVGDIYVRPNYSINFIKLNFIAVRNGISFDEIVGKF